MSKIDSSKHESALTIDWYPQKMGENIKTTNIPLRTDDGAAVNGTLYQVGDAKSVICLMHPREFLACHYLIPILANSGLAVWVQGARSVGVDLRLQHEQAIIDVAAGMVFLREAGFENIILLGNSGGAGLFTYYIQQSQLAPNERLLKSPTGRATSLAMTKMPLVDALVYLAPHPGQGRLLQSCIDPSVGVEGDPLSIIPELDPFNPDNGYKPDGKARYRLSFIDLYRKAQKQRVAKIDQIARDLIERRLTARKKVKLGEFSQVDQLVAAHSPIITVWRTDADLRCLDNSLDPSDRNPGSLWGRDMFTSNYGSVGFGRLCTPESWLSTWSGNSSKAALEITAPSVNLPCLIVEYSGDQTTFPSDFNNIISWLASQDKTHVRVSGDHHGRPLRDGEVAGRYLAADEIVSWLKARSYIDAK